MLHNILQYDVKCRLVPAKRTARSAGGPLKLACQVGDEAVGEAVAFGENGLC